MKKEQREIRNKAIRDQFAGVSSGRIELAEKLAKRFKIGVVQVYRILKKG